MWDSAWKALEENKQLRRDVERLTAALKRIAKGVPGCDAEYIARAALADAAGEEPSK